MVGLTLTHQPARVVSQPSDGAFAPPIGPHLFHPGAHAPFHFTFDFDAEHCAWWVEDDEQLPAALAELYKSSPPGVTARYETTITALADVRSGVLHLSSAEVMALQVHAKRLANCVDGHCGCTDAAWAELTYEIDTTLYALGDGRWGSTLSEFVGPASMSMLTALRASSWDPFDTVTVVWDGSCLTAAFTCHLTGDQDVAVFPLFGASASLYDRYAHLDEVNDGISFVCAVAPHGLATAAIEVLEAIDGHGGSSFGPAAILALLEDLGRPLDDAELGLFAAMAPEWDQGVAALFETVHHIGPAPSLASSVAGTS